MLRKGRDIADRLLRLSAAIVRMSRAFPKEPAAKHIALQVVRSASSAGANYEEARAAESRADFIHKVSLACKEMRETHYWLRLVHESELVERALLNELDEANQLIAILRASIRTAREAADREAADRKAADREAADRKAAEIIKPAKSE